MAKIKAIGLKNFRSLFDTGFIDIKPITIIVGSNSAGKSTFLRTIPLLRQSVEVPKNEPILWWGRLVDFGSFNDSLSKKSNDKELCISLRVEISKDFMNEWAFYKRSEEATKKKSDVELLICIKSNNSNNSSIISRVEISHLRDKYKISYHQNGSINKIEVNNFVWTPGEIIGSGVKYESLIPEYYFFSKKITSKDGANRSNFGPKNFNPLTYELILFLMDKFLHKNTKGASVFNIIDGLDISSKEDFWTSLQKIGDSWDYIGRKLKLMNKNSDDVVGLRNRLLLNSLAGFISRINKSISEDLSGCFYVQPLRATAERYYRRQALAVQEVDSKGNNVPFYLDSMNMPDKNNFNDWMMSNLGASVNASLSGDHISLKITDNTGVEANLADVGFGFSQILPVALQLWVGKNRSRNLLNSQSESSMVLIEQPELHLHPEYQAKVGDLLLASLDDDKLSMIIETHSASLINRIGLRISEDKNLRDKVQILRFEIEKGSGRTVIEKSNFDDDGVLINWPYGFFDA